MEKGHFTKHIAQLDKPNSWQSKFGVKITNVGVMPIPLVLYRFKKILKLTNSDILFVGYILMHKQNDNWPYISLAKITREYKVSQDTLNKTVKRLRKGGFLITTPKKENPKGKGRNYYDLSGLITCLEVLIDKHETLIDKSSWSLDDRLNYGLMKHIEKEASEKRRASIA